MELAPEQEADLMSKAKEEMKKDLKDEVIIEFLEGLSIPQVYRMMRIMLKAKTEEFETKTAKDIESLYSFRDEKNAHKTLMAAYFLICCG